MRNTLHHQLNNFSLHQNLILNKAILSVLLLLFGHIHFCYGNDKFHITALIGNGSIHMVATAVGEETTSESNTVERPTLETLMHQLETSDYQVIDANNEDKKPSKSDSLDSLETQALMEKLHLTASQVDSKNTTETDSDSDSDSHNKKPTTSEDKNPKKKLVIYSVCFKSSSSIETFGDPTNMCFNDSPSTVFNHTYNKLKSVLPTQYTIESITVAMAGYRDYSKNKMKDTELTKLQHFQISFADILDIQPEKVYFCGGDENLLNIMCQIAQRHDNNTSTNPIVWFQLTTCLCAYSFHNTSYKIAPNNKNLEHLRNLKTYSSNRNPQDGGTFQIGLELINKPNIKLDKNFVKSGFKKFIKTLADELTSDTETDILANEKEAKLIWLAFANHILHLNLKELGLLRSCLKQPEKQAPMLDLESITEETFEPVTEKMVDIFSGKRKNVTCFIFAEEQNDVTFQNHNLIDIHLDKDKTIHGSAIWSQKHIEIFKQAYRKCSKKSEEDALNIISGVTSNTLKSNNCDFFIVMDEDRYIPSCALDEFKRKIVDQAKTQDGNPVPIKFIEGEKFSTYMAIAGLFLYK